VNDFASPNRAKLYRKLKEKVETFEIELGDILNKGRLETNLFLRPGDVITVPERLF
jgi:polysaccharide export outer membrane protein